MFETVQVQDPSVKAVQMLSERLWRKGFVEQDGFKIWSEKSTEW